MYVRIPLLGDTNLWKVLLTSLLVLILSRVQKFFNGLKALNYMHGLRVPFQPFSFPGALLPTTRWNPGIKFLWLWRHHLYKQFPNHIDTFSVIPFFFGRPVICSSNLDVCRQVVGVGPKPEFTKLVSLLGDWGTNLVTAEGDVWRKHRRVLGPAFNNNLYENVWLETLNLYHEIVSVEKWGDKDVVDVSAVQTLTFKVALLIIGKCGFGFSFGWSAPPKAVDGKMSFQEAVRIITHTPAFRLLPKWIQHLPFPKFREIRMASEEMMKFMQGEVAAKRKDYMSSGGKLEFEGRKASDIFTLLVNANEEEEGKLKLDDQELVGNVFIMLFAGHETTAHTLAATLALLALHQEIQKEILEQIMTVVGSEREPTFDDYSKLDKVLAAFYEALRLYPTAYVLIREAVNDTVLDVPNARGQEGSTIVPIPKRTTVLVDMIGIQYNPRYFDEPGKFKPSRWYGESNESELFTAFSIGPRACIGRKFATTEAVCFLTMVLRDWKVEPLLGEGETEDAWCNRVLHTTIGITMGMTSMPIRLVRRSSYQ